MSTAAPLPTNTLWTAGAAARGAQAARGAGLSANPAALAVGGDDAFVKALERSRDAARADSARAAQRESEREAAPRRPEAAAQPPRPAPPDTMAAGSSAAQAARRDGDKGSAHGSDDGTAQAGASTDAAARAADRQRRAAGAGKPYPGNTPTQTETKDGAVCFAPEDVDTLRSDEGADAEVSTDLAALSPAAAAIAAAAAAMRAGQGAGADASTSEAAAGANASTAVAAGAAPSVGDAGRRGAPGDLRQRLARAAAAGARDDAGPAGGPAQAAADLAGTARAALAQPGALSALHGGAQASATAAAAATGGASLPGDSAAASQRTGMAAVDTAPASAPDGLTGLATGPQLADVRAAEPFTLPTKASAGPAPEATLWARPGSTDFAPQLGAQLAVWVRDGVHEARLQLNPADMGPVRVDIQLDGSAAQVSLTAGNDQTRQALQDALPALAGSLQDAGFTLAGGGVFDQAPQQRDGGSRDTNSSRAPALGASDSASAGASAQALPARRRGLVDLVA